MATTGSDNKNLNKNSDIPKSVYHKTVCLVDWWLIKAEKDFNGRRLAIGGLEIKEQRAVRIFSSSPIIKKYDLFTLETSDGVTVMLSGSINKSRTEENGFTSELCGHFLIGFPYNWETYADQCFGKESTTRGGQKHEHEEKGLLHATNKKTKEPLPTEETSIDNGTGRPGPLLNPSKRITRNCAAEDHTDPTSFDADVVLPAMLDKTVPVKNPSARNVKFSKGFNNSKNGPDKVKADGVLKSEIKNFCPSVSQDYETDMVVYVEAISRGGVKSSLSSDTEGMVKCVSPSNDSLPKRISKSIRQYDNNVKDGALSIQSTHLMGTNNDASKDLPLPMVSSHVNHATSLNMVVPLNLKTSSKRLGKSERSKKNNNKTKTSLRSEKSAVMRSCTDGTDTNDSTRDVSASLQTDLTNVYPCVVKMTASVDISSDNLTRIPKVEEETSGSSTGKRTNLHSISRSQDYEAVIGIPVEEKLGQGNSFDIIGVVDGIEGTLEQSSSTKPDVVSPKISGRGENSENRPCVENKNDESISTLETLEKPSGHHMVGNCVSSVNIPFCRKLDSSEEIVNQSEARRSSIRVKNLKSKYKEDKTSNNSIESERNKIVSVSKGCDMKSNVDDVDSGLRRICDLDQLNIGVGETAPGLTKEDVDDKSSRNVSQMNCMLSSVSRLSTGALRNLSCGSAYDFSEASTENETCRTPMRLDDTKCTSNLKMSPGQEQSNNKKQKKLGRKKRHAVPQPPVTRSTKEDLSFVSPESLRRSRSGRLLIPRLAFWHNQQPVYGVDGHITGIFTGYQDGPSHLGSSSGSRSEPTKRKRKLI